MISYGRTDFLQQIFFLKTEQVVFNVHILDTMVEVKLLKKDERIKNIGQLTKRFLKKLKTNSERLTKAEFCLIVKYRVH